MSIKVGEHEVETTREGFLVDPHDWNREVSIALAHAHGVELVEAHWEIIHLLREYWKEGNKPPSTRVLVAEIRNRIPDQTVKATKGSSFYLMTLFGPSPAKMAARLAGLPKPEICV